MNKVSLIIFYICLILILPGCSGDKLSPEDEIKQYIKTGVEAAENRSASDLSDLIHQHYSGQKNLDKNQIIKLLRLYFFRHKNIFLFTKIQDIAFHSENEASVTLHVAMAGSVIADVSMLSSLRAQIYKFELELVKEGEWLLQEAMWRRASSSDLQ